MYCSRLNGLRACVSIVGMTSVLAACDRQTAETDDASPEPAVVARVADDTISVAYLERAIRGTSKEERVEYINPPQVRELVETLIDRKLMAARARAAGIDVADELAELPAGLAEDPFQREQILATAYLHTRIAAASDVSAADIEAYYAANVEKFTVPERARVTRVILPTEVAAGHIEELLSQGLSADAIATRADRSVQAGVLWVQRRGELGAMEEAALSLEVGEVSDAFPVAGGFAVVRVDERAASEIRPLQEVSAGIAARLGQQQRVAALDNLRAELRQGVEISVDEQELGAYTWQE